MTWTTEKEQQLLALMREKASSRESQRKTLLDLVSRHMGYLLKPSELISGHLMDHAHAFREALKPFDTEDPQ